MKPVVYLTLFTLCLLCGCRKENSVASDQPVYPVKFNVLSITQQQMGSRATVLSEGEAESPIHYLYYLIYGSDSKFVKKIEQTDDVDSFGTIADSEPAGNYTVIMIGSKNALQITPGSATTGVFKCSAVDDDVFFLKTPVTIDSQGLTKDITLNRVVCYLQAQIEDEIPANVARVELSVRTDASTFSFGTEKVRAEPSTDLTTSKTVAKSMVTDEDRQNVTLGMTILNDAVPMKVMIAFFDSSNTIIKLVTSDDVPFERNKRTILSGKLFTMPTAGFTVTVNSEWNTDPIQIVL